jgi:Tfp pilus assembly protein PilX
MRAEEVKVQGEREGGFVMVMALLVLAMLTVLGVSVCRLSNVDLWIARNEADLAKGFYLAEGGLSREMQELGNGGHRVKNVFHSSLVASSKTAAPPHRLAGEPYDFTVTYMGFAVPVKGFSARAFSRYDYEIEVARDTTRIKARVYTIGPTPE